MIMDAVGGVSNYSPKISVLVPLYNRKHYIEQCIDSALNQTFQDFEIIVRDDGSTDGSADFVAERYAAEISSGKIKLRRNEKNIGQFATDNRLLREATGKYIMILHSDDLYLPHGLQHMYEVAERYQADVVHGCRYLSTNFDGVIKEDIPVKIVRHDKQQVERISLMPNDPLVRFSLWLNDVGIDAQHNIFNRKFFLENDLRFEAGGNRLFALKWLMKAKIFVKTPVLYYIYRDSPDSVTRAKLPPAERVAGFISGQIKLSRYLDDFFARDDFFNDNPELQYIARSNLFLSFNNHWINRLGIYKDGITPELHAAIESAFRKHFGDDAPYPTFLFHWINATMFNKPVNSITLSSEASAVTRSE